MILEWETRGNRGDKVHSWTDSEWVKNAKRKMTIRRRQKTNRLPLHLVLGDNNDDSNSYVIWWWWVVKGVFHKTNRPKKPLHEKMQRCTFHFLSLPFSITLPFSALLFPLSLSLIHFVFMSCVLCFLSNVCECELEEKKYTPKKNIWCNNIEFMKKHLQWLQNNLELFASFVSPETDTRTKTVRKSWKIQQQISYNSVVEWEWQFKWRRKGR